MSSSRVATGDPRDRRRNLQSCSESPGEFHPHWHPGGDTIAAAGDWLCGFGYGDTSTGDRATGNVHRRRFGAICRLRDSDSNSASDGGHGNLGMICDSLLNRKASCCLLGGSPGISR